MTRNSRKLRKPLSGFTLVEILIVVVILGIMAMIVVPQFSNASHQARENTLRDDLRFLRTQIGVYAAQHRDVCPGYAGGDSSLSPTSADFINQMTMYTSEAGATAAAKDATHKFGPYLSKVPSNPLNGLDTILIVDNGAAIPAADDSTGWIYKAETKEIIANQTGTDVSEPLTPHISRRGFTLAESLVASVVLALAVVGVSSAIVASQQQSSAQQEDVVAITLARQLMEEIASRPMELANGTTGAAGWPGVTDKSAYDTIDDFSGYRDTVNGRSQFGRDTAATIATTATPSATVNPSGSTPPALARQEYRRTVSITYPTSLFGTTVTSGEFAVIKVSVNAGSGAKSELSRLVGKSKVER